MKEMVIKVMVRVIMVWLFFIEVDFFFLLDVVGVVGDFFVGVFGVIVVVLFVNMVVFGEFGEILRSFVYLCIF